MSFSGSTPSTARVWKIPHVVERLTKRICEGALIELGSDQLYEEIRQEFADSLREHQCRFPRESFEKKLLEIVWSGERLQDLEETVRFGESLEVYLGQYPFIPAEMAQQKFRELLGVSRVAEVASFEGGINRLVTTEELDHLEEVELPVRSRSDPFEIPVANEDRFSMLVVNGPHIGLQYNKYIQENPLRCALAEAEARGDDAVFLTGGLMYIETKKAQGSLTTHRARTSGYDFHPDVIDPRYRDKATRIRRELPSHEMTYETLKERFLNLLAGYCKIAQRPDGTPEFSGTVYIVLGLNEEQFIEEAAYAEARYWTLLNRNKIQQERKRLERQLSGDELTPQARIKLQERIDALRAEEARMRMTNISPEDQKRFFNKITSFVVREYEKAIPNCKVIGLNTTFVRIGGEIVEIRQSRTAHTTDGDLQEFVKKVGNRRTLDDTLPNTVLLCNPHAVRYGYAVIEGAKQGERRSTQVFQLPVAIDKVFLDKKSRDVIRCVTSLEKLLHHEQFEPGVIRLVYASRMWNGEFLSLGTLRSYEQRRSSKKDPGYIYLFTDTDPHWGHPWKEFYYDEQQKKLRGTGPAVIEMMRRGDLLKGTRMPIHSFHLLDDGVQAHNFPTQSQPHQHVKPFEMIEDQFNRLEQEARDRKDPKAAFEALEQMREEALEQIRLRGENWTQRQFDEYFERMLDPNLDFFAAILARVKKGGVAFRGVSHYIAVDYDTRDIGPITFGTGNHLANTVDREVTEGSFYARHLRSSLRGMPGVSLSPEELALLIRAPLYGNDHIGWGTVSANGGYEWGVSLRSAPSRKSGAGDPLRRMVQNVLERGNYTRFFEGRHAIHLSGDIHRFGVARVSDATIVSCASGTDTDPYGERGFSPNNTGNLVIGLPVDGPDSGPIRIITFRSDFIRSFFREPFEIDWEALLPNPV